MPDLPGAVLFACSENAIRSPIAEALMKSKFGTRIFVDSAGVRAGDVNPFAMTVLDEIGVDLSGHRPKTLDQLEDDSFDIIITLSPEAHHKALEMTRSLACEVEYWPTLDPSAVEGSRERVLESFRETRDMIEQRILRRFPRFGGPTV